MMKYLLGTALGLLAANAAFAQTAALTNGAGDGNVSVTVYGSGGFGSASGSGSDAIYDPVGPTAAASTTYESYVYLGFGGNRTNISTLGSTINAATATSVTSTFSTSGLNFGLAQTLTTLLDANSVQTGSLLTQTYTFTNSTTDALVFDLVRYLDGDLNFNGNISDGGGRFINTSGQEILFETDSAIGSADSDTFIGIYNEGGTSTGYQISSYSGLRSLISGGGALGNVVQGDGDDADQFIDAGGGYDVTLGLGRAFSLGAGGTGTFTTYTIFGTGTPGSIVVPPTGDVPEPATWAMMVMGFGLAGSALRRNARTLATA